MVILDKILLLSCVAGIAATAYFFKPVEITPAEQAAVPTIITVSDETTAPPATTAPEATEPEKYIVARYVWDELGRIGYNQYIRAGIIGNMMTECGGQTLDLQYDIYDPSGSFYGLCQWSGYYCPDVQGISLEGQVNYLEETIRKEFNTFGPMYGCDYDQFIEITEERTAALLFAKIYERCYSGSYGIRQDNASVALEYFTGG